jgi:hypothetical protein
MYLCMYQFRNALEYLLEYQEIYLFSKYAKLIVAYVGMSVCLYVYV